MVELMCERVVSTAGVDALIGPRTVTDSAMPPVFSSMRTDTASPIVSATPRVSNRWNPARAAATA
jgi:hypothetical protein